MCKCGPGKGPIVSVLVTSIICFIFTIPALVLPWGYYTFELDVKTTNDDAHYSFESLSAIAQGYIVSS